MACSAHTRRKPLWPGSSWVWVMVMVMLVSGVNSQRGAFPDFKGDYCRNRRPSECCDGRYDDCAVPLSGTLCYCDEFCDRTQHPDCCPDFWEVCRGWRPPIPPPELMGCIKDGVFIPNNGRHKFNCNECRCLGSTLECDNDACMVEEELVNRINRANVGWSASNYSMFWGWKAREGLTLRTGTHNPESLSMHMFPILLRPDLSRIPSFFDARLKPEWQGRVSGVNNQGWCGASWAFSTLGVAQDRLSIESQGNETVVLAPQHLLSCDRRGQSGCKGGHVERAWQYLRRIGSVNEECFPYQSGNLGQIPKCPRGDSLATLRCVSNTVKYQRKDFYRVEPAYRISGKEEDIQWEILTNGPVQAMMKVHRDFFLYRGGVYSHSGLEGSGIGPASHSVRILGWGEDASVKYWLAANSWGRQWGENGYFRIRRGYNESDIETFILAVRARLGDYSRGLQYRSNRIGRGAGTARKH